MNIEKTLFLVYLLTPFNCVKCEIALDSDFGVCQGEVYRVTKTLPLYGRDYLLKGNLISPAFLKKPTVCTLMLEGKSTNFICSDTRWGAIVGRNASNVSN